MKESQYRFRVWDDFGKEMYYFDFCTNIEVRNGCLWVVHDEGAICLDYVPPTHVMQYTTRKDKKMQRIYDGDILLRSMFATKLPPHIAVQTMLKIKDREIREAKRYFKEFNRLDKSWRINNWNCLR